jgi:hypothetical protein
VGQGSPRRARIQAVAAASTGPARAEVGVRWSRVKAARERIAAGYYDRAEVRGELLDAILEELADA